MPESPDLEARVTALETEVRQLAERVRHSEQDAAAARVLAGGADRDVAEIRTEIREVRTEVREFRDQNNRVLNAMREDMTDMRTDLTAMRTDLTGLQQKVDNGFIEMRGRFDAAAAGHHQIADILTRLLARHGERPNDK
jgi:chromosome segregation ATPase